MTDNRLSPNDDVAIGDDDDYQYDDNYDTGQDFQHDYGGYDYGAVPDARIGERPFQYKIDEYPCICEENDTPISIEEVTAIFDELQSQLGFQKGSAKNMLAYFLSQFDSRSSRMTASEALITLHADYIGGENANYRKWYFSAMLEFDGVADLSADISSADISSANANTAANTTANTAAKTLLTTTLKETATDNVSQSMLIRDLESKNYKSILQHWNFVNGSLSAYQMAKQIALYLLVWGEANQLRFMPEAICFIFKLALDKVDAGITSEECPKEGTFLHHAITPLYRFIKNQTYKVYNGDFIKRDRDHRRVIGYDDVNQLFWYKKGLERIVIGEKKNQTRLMAAPRDKRYDLLSEVKWKKVFYKTYQERRTWMHLFTNFNRIWIIHLCSFWYYTAFNSPTLYTPNYMESLNNQPLPQVTFSVVALGGTIACLIQLVATAAEWSFVPRKWPGAQHLLTRFIIIFIITIINAAPSVYILGVVPLDTYSKTAYGLSIAQFVISILTFVFFATQPLGGLFGSYLNPHNGRISKYHASREFTASFPKLEMSDKISSYLLWAIIFACKFTESYYFLTLSVRDPVRALSTMKMDRCVGEVYFGNFLCRYQPQVILFLIYVIDLVLFFLDTYLWYIVCNCVFSCVSSYKAGFSIVGSMKNQYGIVPKRIYTKILTTAQMEVKYKPKILVSQVWNAIVIAMYKEHILTLAKAQKLLYHQIESEYEGKFAIKDPSFFVEKGHTHADLGTDYFAKNSEAERRFSFFARSLASNMPEGIAVENMPTFSVLIPHYSEKVILSLKEVIKENDKNSKLSLLEYLKVLYPDEWECFVNDTRIVAGQKLEEERNNKDYYYNHVSTEEESSGNPYWSKILDKPFLLVGYKSAIPEFTLRTRLWASLRSQTLYRTVSGFMNYGKALRLLYKVENPELISEIAYDGGEVEKETEFMAFRKFKMIVSMQRFDSFNDEERENAEFLLRAYPYLKIAYLHKRPATDEEKDQSDDGFIYYSCLIDGFSPFDEGKRRIPYYQVQLSGNPILGDGKADNQNHAIIFHRGEYIQVVDANQDNYLEECLKIRSVLAEFEELTEMNVNPYIPDLKQEHKNPVAIVGAREYIFSEHSGVLGDVAAGKEQTFGTLFARTLAKIGGKLHYGHPDFLNSIFMNTRGGISKAQKGLHLNEDIYAGMTAVCRGGRIKHSDYFQCGKGRDLGFGSILNFTTKIGAGMGEQLLSREYYYLGTQLPLDKFLSFYYAHAGFHINNLLIILSVNLFTCILINLGALTSESIKCVYNKDVPITDPRVPLGCYNIQPILDWITRFVLSIFICFFIAFLPLVVQELTERGLWRAITRLTFHFLSMSPLFEVFVCQIYSTSLTSNLVFGGAKYISSGRGFATARLSFCDQYSKFAATSIYSGVYLFLVMTFACITMWQPAILWFWITTVSLCLAPFIFNPHQFSLTDFFLDYRDFLRWLTRGNTKYHPRSWITFIRESRSRLTGYRKGKSILSYKNAQKPSFSNVFMSEIVTSLFFSIFSFFGYTFINGQNGVKNVQPVNSILRLMIVILIPIIGNFLIVLFSIPIALTVGSTFRCCCQRTASVMAGFAHGTSLIIHLLTWEVVWFLEGWSFSKALLALICGVSIQNILFKLITIVFLSREEYKTDVNKAWWDGSWLQAETDTFKVLLFGREFTVKIIELSLFSFDFIIGHCILFVQTPLLLIPYIDKWHSIMLFWLKPTHKILLPAISPKKRALRVRRAVGYGILYVVVMLFLLSLMIVPLFTHKYIPKAEMIESGVFKGLIQPSGQNNNDTGPVSAPASFLRPVVSTR